MATFYFNGDHNGSDGQTLGNWWMSYDAETHSFSVPATSLPTSTDDIVVFGGLGGSGLTVANAVFGVSPDGYHIGYVRYTEITVTGLCEFNGHESGNAAWNEGVVNGNVRFNYYIADSAGRVDSYYYASGAVTGAVLDANNNPISTWVFNGFWALWGTAQGDCIFYGESYTIGTVTGNATFNDYSGGPGYILGNATFNDNSRPEGGNVEGIATFNTTNLSNFGIYAGFARFTLISALWCVNYTYSNGSGNNEIIYDKGINGSSILGIL